MSASLREKVCWASQMLPRAGLVTMHSGNVSGLDRERGRLFIKPSGVDYELLTPDDIVEVDLDTGTPIKGQLKPSVDLPHHLFLYRRDMELRGVVHTHSNYATAFAAAGRNIPPFLTSIADEFGGPIPCAPYVDNQGEHIGEAIFRHKTQAPAILLASHGVFAWGTSVEGALKAAVMVEDAARTVWLSLAIGTPAALPAVEIAKWHGRYHDGGYGQN
jgi:L-ribulose-5-phosphate 4-epimerase